MLTAGKKHICQKCRWFVLAYCTDLMYMWRGAPIILLKTLKFEKFCAALHPILILSHFLNCTAHYNNLFDKVENQTLTLQYSGLNCLSWFQVREELLRQHDGDPDMVRLAWREVGDRQLCSQLCGVQVARVTSGHYPPPPQREADPIAAVR